MHCMWLPHCRSHCFPRWVSLSLSLSHTHTHSSIPYAQHVTSRSIQLHSIKLLSALSRFNVLFVPYEDFELILEIWDLIRDLFSYVYTARKFEPTKKKGKTKLKKPWNCWSGGATKWSPRGQILSVKNKNIGLRVQEKGRENGQTPDKLPWKMKAFAFVLWTWRMLHWPTLWYDFNILSNDSYFLTLQGYH